MKKYEPTIDPSYAADELYIQKEKVKYQLKQQADKQREKLNEDPEAFADALQDLDTKLKTALASVEETRDTEELRRTEDKETPVIAVVYPTALVAEAERLAKLAQEAVAGVDTDHDARVSVEEKAVADKAIAVAQAVYDAAQQAVAGLPESTPEKEELRIRLAHITIPASPELTPPDPAPSPAPAPTLSAVPTGYPPYIPPAAKPVQPLNVSSVFQLEKHEALPQTSDASRAYGVYTLTGALSLFVAYGLKRVISAELRR